MQPWPVVLRAKTPRGEEVRLRPLERGDRQAWRELRAANHEWLEPWEATPPDGEVESIRFSQLVRRYNAEAREVRMLPFVIEVGGRLVGQMHIYGIAWGSQRSAGAGYWVAQDVAGRGITPTALGMACDYCFSGLGLHRIEVNIRPENTNSLAVVHKLGFRDEGLRMRFLHIDGAWRDHRSFALTVEDLGGKSVLSRLTHSQHQSHARHTDSGPQ
jgi:ribosomal-protein-alanine N-acetyltransferase